MKEETGERKGWFGRMGWRLKAVLAAIAVIAVLIFLLVIFIAGMTTGYLFSQAGLADDCARAQGIWNDSAKTCEMRDAAPAPVTGSSYQCENGTRFSLERTDPEAVRLTVERGLPRILPLVGTGDEGSRYGDGTVSALLGTSSVSYEDAQGGVSTTCALANG